MTLRIIYIVLIIAASNNLAAQSIYNSTSIFIPQSITVYSGDVENNGLILNSGTLETNGNWNNQYVYQGLGTIVLSGTDQSIDNNNQAVQHLLVNGAGSKTLSGKLFIDGSIEFAAGIVKVGANDTLVVRDGATIEGGSVASFVEGALTVGGTGYKFFPVGRASTYYPVSFTDITGVGVVTQLAAFTNMPMVRTTSPVTVDKSVFWERKTITGSFFGSPILASIAMNITDPQKIVFVTGRDLQSEFNVVENNGIQTIDGISFALSKTPIQDSFLAIGESIEKPAMPAYLSTTLSPNASNPENRIIKMFGADIDPASFHFVVMNRWGNTVFESRSLDIMSTDGWNGRDGGQLLPSGPYPYALSYVDATGKEQAKRGLITIIY
ncbi:MAG TPA: gliding motility-associated C-terminal domain-containing protein [Cyclobacteriaceae bacterium]